MTLTQDFYTKKDLCNLFGRSIHTINRWIRNGVIPHAGHFGLWSRTVVERMLNSGQATLKDMKKERLA